jgi:hypothetical protein
MQMMGGMAGNGANKNGGPGLFDGTLDSSAAAALDELDEED